MAFLNYDQVRELSSRPLAEQLIKSAAEKTPKDKDVFLSYSSKDREHIAGVLRFFGEFGASVYIDTEDISLPEVPSTTTAAGLCDRIEQSRRLVVLVTRATESSLWVPWELGVAHGSKGVSPVALLPLSTPAADADEDWMRQHYLGLYPRIRYGALRVRGQLQESQWMVLDPRDNRAWPIRAWLHDEIAEAPEL